MEIVQANSHSTPRFAVATEARLTHRSAALGPPPNIKDDRTTINGIDGCLCQFALRQLFAPLFKRESLANNAAAKKADRHDDCRMLLKRNDSDCSL